MSCRWQFQIPHADGVCLDCEVLTPEKCVFHGPHKDCHLTLDEYPIADTGHFRWLCDTHGWIFE